MYDGPKRDFEKLCREFAARAREMAQGIEDGARHTQNGDLQDYLKFVASGISATAHAVEQCPTPTFEEWRERMRKLPAITLMTSADDPFGDGSGL